MESLCFHHAVPGEGSPPVGVGRDAQGISAFVCFGFECIHRAAVFEITDTPHRDHATEGKSCSEPAGWSFVVHPDFAIDKREEGGQYQTGEHQYEYHRLHNENDVPRVPSLGKRPQWAHSIVVGEIQQNVAQAREHREAIQQPPTRWKIWIPGFTSTHAPEGIHESDNNSRNQKRTKKRMSESSMVGKSEYRPLEVSKHVQIRGFRRQRHGCRSQSRLAIEPGTTQTRACQEMGDRFQSMMSRSR